MRLHGNAKLTPFQRDLLCVRVRVEGWTVAEAAEAAGCVERTAYRWLARYDAGEAMTGMVAGFDASRDPGQGSVTGVLLRDAGPRDSVPDQRDPLAFRCPDTGVADLLGLDTATEKDRMVPCGQSRGRSVAGILRRTVTEPCRLCSSARSRPPFRSMLPPVK